MQPSAMLLLSFAALALSAAMPTSAAAAPAPAWLQQMMAEAPRELAGRLKAAGAPRWTPAGQSSQTSSSDFATLDAYCPDIACAVAGGNCSSQSSVSGSTGVRYGCPANTYDSYVGSQACTCKAVSAAPALGSTCVAANVNSCGPDNTAICYRPNTTVEVGTCYRGLEIGDSCSSVYSCLPPRVCVNGKCAANLAVGDTCRDSSGNEEGLCPLTAYCSITTSKCTTLPGSGASCSDSFACAAGLSCDGTSLATLVCSTIRTAYIPAGSPATQAYECVDYQLNTTSGLCLSYATQLAIFKANYAGKSCSGDTDCGFIGECGCSTVASGNTRTCRQKFISLPSIYVLAIQQATGTGRATCESTSLFSADAAYCNNAFYKTYYRAVCKAIRSDPTLVPATITCDGTTVDSVCSAYPSAASPTVAAASLMTTAAVAALAALAALLLA